MGISLVGDIFGLVDSGGSCISTVAMVRACEAIQARLVATLSIVRDFLGTDETYPVKTGLLSSAVCFPQGGTFRLSPTGLSPTGLPRSASTDRRQWERSHQGLNIVLRLGSMKSCRRLLRIHFATPSWRFAAGRFTNHSSLLTSWAQPLP
jgi:hypothetical protein